MMSYKCGTCGELVYPDIEPETRSEEVAHTLGALLDIVDTTLVTEWITSAKHPMCSDCFIGWIHNITGLNDE